ncbi:MAG TPA: hypothetical protein VKI61_03815 [Chitinophagaceae bacterium]|nr:hypothetical protein [Chitinophagaceae bacterium]
MHFHAVFLGAGPAGMGPILKSLKNGSFSNLVNKGIAIVEQSQYLVRGSITGYKINSDTLVDAFLECLDGCTLDFFDASELSDAIKKLKYFSGGSIPLKDLDIFYLKLGQIIRKLITGFANCKVFLNTRAEKIIINHEGDYELILNNGEKIITKNLVLAVGGRPYPSLGDNGFLQGSLQEDRYKHKTWHSDELLSGKIDYEATSILRINPNVLILGGSHSAFSSADYILKKFSDVYFIKNSIRIYCKKPPKIYFQSKEEAMMYGYRDFDDNDFCPVTGRLFRLAGLRMDGRRLYMRMIGMLNGETENRVSVNCDIDLQDEIEYEYSSAGLVILALGYRFNMIPIFDSQLNPVKLNGQKRGEWVNSECQVLDCESIQIPGLFAIGLASGYTPKGVQGGEPSFTGQTSGIWFYQNIVGEIILAKLLSQ